MVCVRNEKTMCHSGSDGSFHSGAAESQQNLVVKVGITVRSGPVYGWFENVYTEPTTSKCHNCLLTHAEYSTLTCWMLTSQPFGVILDRTQNRATFPKTSVNHCVTRQEVRHGGRVEIPTCGKTRG